MSMRTRRPYLRARVEDHAQVADGQVLVDIEAELAQLERDVGVDGGGIDAVEQVEDLVAGGVGFTGLADAFAEVVHRRQQAAGIELPGGVDRLVDRFAGHKAAGDEPGGGKAGHQRPGPAGARQVQEQRAEPGLAVAIQQKAAAGQRQQRKQACAGTSPACRRFCDLRFALWLHSIPLYGFACIVPPSAERGPGGTPSRKLHR